MNNIPRKDDTDFVISREYYPKCEECSSENIESQYIGGVWDVASFRITCLDCLCCKQIMVDNYFDYPSEQEVGNDPYWGQESI